MAHKADLQTRGRCSDDFGTAESTFASEWMELEGFFEPIAEESISLAMEALKSIVSSSGCVELLTSEETAEWLAQDALYKAEQTSLHNTVGNSDATTNWLNSILSLHVRNSSADDVPCKRAKRLAEDMMSVAATSHRVAASRLKKAQAVDED